MYGYSSYREGPVDEEALREEELEAAERMVRNGSSVRQIMRRQFSTIEQSDIYKMYRKFGMDPDEMQDDVW